MPAKGSPAEIVAVVPDLLIESRIEAAAQLQSLGVRAVPVNEAAEAISTIKPSLVVMDLAAATDNIRELMEATEKAGAIAVGYYPHVEAQLRAAAREAGVEHIYPRSRFLRELPRILAAALQR